MASNDTYAGALEVLAKQLATMAGLVDANLPFVSGLLEAVTTEMRSPEMAMQKAGIIPSSQQNPQGQQALGLPPGVMPGPDGAGMMAGGGGGGMGGMPGGPPQPTPMNPDELRRILSAGPTVS